MAFAQKGIQIAEVIKNHTIVNGATYGAAIWSAILYTANSSNYAPMIAIADKIKTKKEVLVTTIIGGVILTLALTMVCTMCLGWLPDIIEVAIPHLKITQDIGVSWLYAFYIVALLAAYITTSTTFIFAAGKRFENIFFFRNVIISDYEANMKRLTKVWHFTLYRPC